MSEYDILQNKEGEILIIIGSYEGEPEYPRFVYDGGDKALISRNKEKYIHICDIPKDARIPLKSVDKVMIIEIDGDDIKREYSVPVRLIKDIKTILKGRT